MILHFQIISSAPLQVTASVVVISFVLFVSYRATWQSDAEDKTTVGLGQCEKLLRAEAYKKTNPLQAHGCRLRHYQTPELVKCLSHFADGLQNKSHFHIAFSGDSRIRQVYHSFCGMLPLYDAQISGHHHTRRRVSVLHGNAEVTSEILRLKLTFLWHPYPDSRMKTDLLKWAGDGSTSTPDVLVTGNMLWSMTELPGHFSDYKRGWSEISQILRKLSRTAKVIWLEQDPVNEQRYHDISKDFTKADVNNRKIQDYNNAVLHSLKDSDVVVWSSSHPVLAEYTRACASNPDRFDSWRTWYCGDAMHSGFRHVHLYQQHLLNYLCNPHMGNSYEKCCTEPTSANA